MERSSLIADVPRQQAQQVEYKNAPRFESGWRFLYVNSYIS
jgi:hypothetical protein